MVLLGAIIVSYCVVVSWLGFRAYHTAQTQSQAFGLKPTSVTGSSDASSWVDVGSYRGVATFKKSVTDSKLLAFKGVLETHVHISVVLGTFFENSLGPQWVDLLSETKQFPLLDQKGRAVADADVLYQYYKFPWPVADRDFVLQRKFVFRDNSVTVRYQSVEDARVPHVTSRIRGESPYTLWMFEYNKKTKNTTITLETIVDNKGSLPSWLVNSMQKSWPGKTITALVRVAQEKSLKHNKVARW